jgi:hypothetical protein
MPRCPPAPARKRDPTQRRSVRVPETRAGRREAYPRITAGPAVLESLSSQPDWETGRLAPSVDTAQAVTDKNDLLRRFLQFCLAQNFFQTRQRNETGSPRCARPLNSRTDSGTHFDDLGSIRLLTPRMHPAHTLDLIRSPERHVTCFDAVRKNSDSRRAIVCRPGVRAQSLPRGPRRPRGVESAIEAAHCSRFLAADDACDIWLCWGAT